MFYGNNYNEEPGIFQVINPANLQKKWRKCTKNDNIFFANHQI